MVNKFKFVLIILFMVAIFRSKVSAQIHFSVNQITVYDQNIFRNYLGAADWVNQTSLNFQYHFRIGKFPLRFDYSGDLNLFYYYSDRLSHAHQAGLESLFYLNQNVRSNFGVSLQFRKYKPEFEFYNYQTAVAFVQIQFDKWQTIPMSLGYRFRQRDFANLTQLSYQEHYGFFQIKHFLPSRTTIIGEFKLGQKKYTNLQSVEEVVIVTSKTPGKGRGQGHGRGNIMMPSDTSVYAYNLAALKAQLMNLNMKLAQSIFSKTGMSIEFAKQFAPSNNIRYLTGLEYLYNKDDDLYDDPYSYGSNELEATITQMLPWQSTLKIYVNWADKKYLYSIVTDSTFGQTPMNEKRSDQQRLIGMTFQKNIEMNKILNSLSFYASANYLANRSNDRYFDFKGFFLHSGFELVF